MSGQSGGKIVPEMDKRIFLPLFGLMMALVMLVPARSNAQVAPDQRFGMTEAFWLPDEARELGVGWERILFYWREIQPEGPDDWNTLHVLEEWLVEADTQGREVVGLIKNTAPWASVDGTEAGLPKGLSLPVDDPENLWANYVGRLADYYGPRGVHHWIIWNEPEIARGVYGFEFAGTAVDYYQMLKTAYMVIKQRDPEGVIHLAGLTWWHDPTFLDRLLAIAAADPEAEENQYYFDVISLHIYFRTETIKSIIQEVERIQGRYGLEKPIWINETNAPPNLDPEWPVNRPRFNIDLDQQAWFIVQALALGFASGAERIGVYKLLDIHLPPGGESFGLVRPDQSRRPAYSAYKLATRCFGAFEDTVMEEAPLFYHITFSRPGSLTHVAWSRTPAASAVQIHASAESGTLLTLSGTTSRALGEQESYILELPGQRCDQECLVGGEPLILVEEVGEDHYSQPCLNFLSADEEPAITPTATGTAAVASAEGGSQSGPRTGQRGSTGVDSEMVGERTPNSGVASVRRQNESSDADAVTHEPAPVIDVATPEPGKMAVTEVAGSANAPGTIGDQEEGRGSIGLWFLGLGAMVALILTFSVLRAKISRRA